MDESTKNALAEIKSMLQTITKNQFAIGKKFLELRKRTEEINGTPISYRDIAKAINRKGYSKDSIQRYCDVVSYWKEENPDWEFEVHYQKMMNIRKEKKKKEDAVEVAKQAEKIKKAGLSENTIKIIHNDCALVETFDNKFQLVLTDIPYGRCATVEGEGEIEYNFQTLKKSSQIAFNNLVDSGWYIALLGDRYMLDFARIIENAGFIYRCHCYLRDIVYPKPQIKNIDQLTTGKLFLCFQKPPKSYSVNANMGYQEWENYLEATGEEYEEAKEWSYWGQCVSPFMKIIEYFTKPSDWVLDQYAGGGTTLIAAARTNRKAVGVEKEVSQYNKILVRIAEEEKSIRSCEAA